MFDQAIKFSRDTRTDFLIKLFSSLVAVCLISPYEWQINPEVDVKFGSLMVLLVASVWGFKIGGIVSSLYFVFGLAGLPVFSGHQGGMHYLIPDTIHGYSESTGFLFGYIISSILVGFLVEKQKQSNLLYLAGLFFLGHFIIISIGIYHINSIPGNSYAVLPMLKSLIPSFLIKLGLFIIILKTIERRVR